MGRQVNFYLSNVDQEELARKLDAMSEMAAALPPFPSPQVRIQTVSQLARWKSGEHDTVLFRPADSALLTFRQSSPELGYFVDLFRSPVIEFSRCIMTNDQILRGRVYYIAGFIEDDHRDFKKPPDFIKWATDVFKIVKKHCVERRDGEYIGREALSLVNLGYRLGQ